MSPEARVTALRDHRPTTRVPVASVQGSLALDLHPVLEPPEVPADLRVTPGADVVEIDRQLRRRLTAWCHRYVQAAVEIVSGDRPTGQLARWSSRRVHEDLTRRAVLVARAGGHQPGGGRSADAVRAHVLGVHTCFLREDAVEASAHVKYGERSRAIAARFEVRRDRWVCVALDFS